MKTEQQTGNMNLLSAGLVMVHLLVFIILPNQHNHAFSWQIKENCPAYLIHISQNADTCCISGIPSPIWIEEELNFSPSQKGIPSELLISENSPRAPPRLTP